MAESKACDSSEVSQLLGQWAKVEMNFSSARGLEVKRLSNSLLPLCKGTAMVGLWNQVTYHVKSRFKAEEIRKNIKLGEQNTKNVKLSSEVEEKSRALKVLERDIESMQLQVKRHKEELQQASLELTDAEKNERLLEMKSCMYQNHTKYLEGKSAVLKSFSQWVSEIFTVYQKRLGQTEISEKLEIECGKEVHQVCCLIGNGNSRPMQLQTHLPHIYASIGNLVKNHHPEIIVRSLTSLSKNATLSLKEKEGRVDFLDELKKLRSQYMKENDSEKDGTTKLETIQTMLTQSDLDYVNSFTQAKMCKTNTGNMLHQIERQRNLIASHFELQYELEPTNLQLAVDLLDAEIELSTVKGSVRSFQSSVARLQQDIRMKTEARDRLHLVKAKIDSFTDTLTLNQNRIIELTKHNSAVKSKVNERQTQVLNFARSLVCEKVPDIWKNCVNMQSSLANRLAAFSHVDLNKLWRVDMGPDLSCQIRHLSIYKHLDISQAKMGKSFYQKTAQSLGIHSHVVVSAMLRRAIDAKKEIQRNEHLKSLSVREEICGAKLKTLRQLAEEGAKVEKRQVEGLELKYKSALDVLESALQQCEVLDQMINTWYEQPAQYQTPWLTAEGRTLAEWKRIIENPETSA